jgi:predicted ATP-grasp superfamily ATP-dependent carboligase
VGASVRAAAYSARRAGFHPLACDLFADRDLQELCPTIRVGDYPSGLVAAASRHPSSPWLYTGALENHPEIVDRIASVRPLLGNSGQVLRAVRDPWRVAAALQRRGLTVPRCEHVGGVAADEGWLLKRRHSAGGAGVRPGHGASSGNQAAGECFLQQHIAGRACAAVYVAARGRATLVGVTEQLIGSAWCGSRGFQYCGSVGPLRLSAATIGRFRRIGNCLAREFRLTGLFGVDAILNRRGVWPVEVNPRYTASIEVLERALGVATIGWHVAACLQGGLPAEPATSRKLPWFGKAILFARRAVEIDERPSRAARLANRTQGPASPADEAWPTIADIPVPGSRIPAHRPILTMLCAGTTRADVLRQLRASARYWQAHLERT